MTTIVRKCYNVKLGGQEPPSITPLGGVNFMEQPTPMNVLLINQKISAKPYRASSFSVVFKFQRIPQ
jgi:hypothetical protein